MGFVGVVGDGIGSLCRNGNGTGRCSSRRRVRVVRFSLEDWVFANAKTKEVDWDGKCKQGVRSGSELLSFPESSAFAPGVVEKELASVLNVQGLDDVTALALYLICVKYGVLDSQFKQYVDSLPESLDLPIFWTDAELEYLRGSSLLEKVKSIKVRISEEFSRVLQALPGKVKEEITLDRYTWAQGILFSRAFELPPSLTIVLLPGADSFPTSRSGNSVVRATKGGLFGQDKNVALVADADIFRGDQVVVTRNAESNAQFLMDYGIVYEDSPALDAVDLEFGVSPLDPFYDDKVDILQEMNMSIALNFRVTAGCNEYREEDMEQLEYIAQYLRLVCLGGPDSFLLEAVFRSEVWDFMALPVSKENEKTVREKSHGDEGNGFGSSELSLDSRVQCLSSGCETWLQLQCDLQIRLDWLDRSKSWG
uniref:Rubisco LSMT substrate-binding domain-containing protein n=1 Tax=Rhodosorus marinus TaxID=101924 RepID=A0A7S3A360_9RHOD|mmetsp:Transcript_43051/g.168524  ORF Transcript_43051/g.168524 Transcript_43051/m.168524 type:complete len:423 (+) Transcript_43051:72-1340(+)